jgi:hypothetical protein
MKFLKIAHVLLVFLLTATGVSAAEKTVVCSGKRVFKNNEVVVREVSEPIEFLIDAKTGQVKDPTDIFNVCSPLLPEHTVECSCVATEKFIECESKNQLNFSTEKSSTITAYKFNRFNGFATFSHVADGTLGVTIGTGELKCEVSEHRLKLF